MRLVCQTWDSFEKWDSLENMRLVWKYETRLKKRGLVWKNEFPLKNWDSFESKTFENETRNGLENESCLKMSPFVLALG